MKFIIADSNRLRAQAFSDFLLSMADADLEIPVLCHHADELMELIKEERPQIVFIDIDFGGRAYDFGAQILKKYWPYRFWYFTAERPVDIYSPEYSTAGAVGVLKSPIDAPQLFATLRTLCKLAESNSIMS